MKKKFASLQEYNKSILPETKISFATVSPFGALSFPPNKTIFAALYGNLSYASGPSLAVGTLEIARRGEGKVTIDFDQYPVFTTGTPSILEIVGPKKPLYHWSSDLPPHLRGQTPEWVAKLIEDVKHEKE